MATLYQVSIQARRALFFILIAVIVILVIDNVSKYLNSRLPNFNPNISCFASPNEILGEIPKPTIPSLAISDQATPSFLVEGAFTRNPDTVFVYSIERPREKLDTVSSATRTAAELGFNTSQVVTTGNDLLWENAEKTRSLRFNKLTQTWRMRTQYFQDVIALQSKRLLASEASYESPARDLVGDIGFNENSVARGLIAAKFSKLGADGLFTAPVAGVGADYVTIDVYRSVQQTSPLPDNALPQQARDLCNFQPENALVYTSDPRKGSLHMVISDDARDAKTDVYEVDFIDFEYNYGLSALRRIVTPDVAWERVRAGEGSLAYLNAANRDYFANYESVAVNTFTVLAAETEIAYYEPTNWDGFVYPIYVFRGNAQLSDGRSAEFVFYVDALQRVNLTN